MIKRVTIILFVAAALFPMGCVTAEMEIYKPDSHLDPQTVKLQLKLKTTSPQAFTSRANPTDPNDLMHYIDYVHVLIFKSSGPTPADTDSIVFREYLNYGVEQNIYLRSNNNYWIYVVANLDAANTNIGNAATFFDDVYTLADLRDKYIIASSRSVEQVRQIVMATETLQLIQLPNIVGGTAVPWEIELQRLSSKIIFNIHNRVNASTRAVESNVFPVAWNVVNLPNSSFLMKRNVVTGLETHDYPMTGAGDTEIQSRYYQSTAQLLPPAQTNLVTYNGNTYTLQSFELYSFENRRGSVGGLTNVFDRNTLAPEYASFVQLTSFTHQDRSLLHYIHIGKGRPNEPNIPDVDDISNFDIDRSCIYHMNVYINGLTNVTVDSRTEYLDNHVIFNTPDLSRIDGHYMDIPAWISGLNGYAKIVSGTGTVNSLKQCNNFIPMPAANPNGDAPNSWLRFSFRTPYNPNPYPDPNYPLYTSAPATSLYVCLNSGGFHQATGATVIMHLDEYVNNFQRASGVATPSSLPTRRSAVIRVGYVSGAESPAEYEQGVLDGVERVIYYEIGQYGVRTIGQFGGYRLDATGNLKYNDLLGVEHFEEYTFQYYLNSPDGDDLPFPNNGPFWQYRPTNVLGSYFHMFDGKSTTINHYDFYRNQFPPSGNGVPPVRGETIQYGFIPNTNPPNNPANIIYNPTHNTNAADYCMRKNRDYSGTGILSGSDVKWYMPTPTQLQQVSLWRSYLQFPTIPAIAVTASGREWCYWTNNEASATNAYAVNFAKALSPAANPIYIGDIDNDVPKNTRHRIRCVRDIVGTEEINHPMMYIASDNTIAVNLTDYYPPNMLADSSAKVGITGVDNRNPVNNTQAATFLISKWYLGSSNTYPTRPAPITVAANSSDCASYREWSSDPGGWSNPTQRELNFIYANRGILNQLLEELPGTNTSSAYYYHLLLSSGTHFAWTTVTNGNNSRWTIDFATGINAEVAHNSSHYQRCVKYVNPSNLPPQAP